jgi:hypothetical protein
MQRAMIGVQAFLSTITLFWLALVVFGGATAQLTTVQYNALMNVFDAASAKKKNNSNRPTNETYNFSIDCPKDVCVRFSRVADCIGTKITCVGPNIYGLYDTQHRVLCCFWLKSICDSDLDHPAINGTLSTEIGLLSLLETL